MNFIALSQTYCCRHTAVKSLGLVLLFYTWVVHAETGNPHLIHKNTPQLSCKNCHIANLPFAVNDNELLLTNNNSIDIDAFNQDGVAMCSSCHDPNDGHKVGLNIDFSVPADLPLDEKNDMTCLTCHYTHGSLSSDRPQASFSFMDKWVDAERLHKSFLLRRSNVDGELCLICHKVPQGTK